MGASDWEGHLHAAGALALYAHVPFCRSKCAYCDFSSLSTRADDPLVTAYAASLARMIGQAADAGLLEGCRTGYLGGGTPTLMGPAVGALLSRMAPHCPRELSCEANPDSLDAPTLAAIASSGATRVSVGVQSTSDEELAALGRIHTSAQATDALARAVAAGLDVSCDLMCAIPRQGEGSWRRSLDDVLSAGVCHVSVYPLQIEEGTAFGRRYADGDPAFNSEDVQAARMREAERALTEAGLLRYEVASYARPGRSCAHNRAYWTGLPYLGLGTGAAGMLTAEGYARLRAVAPQLPPAPEGAARARLTVTSGRREVAAAAGLCDLDFDLEFLTAPQAAAEDLMLGMRLTEGVGEALLAHARSVLGEGAVDDALEEAAAESLVRATPAGGAAPTERGWLLGNELFGLMWGLAPGTVASASARGRGA
ncbi:MAG: coproporphyrinogen-III oxidase family protein [Parafannyhessea sp.]|uniref:coproporphyrinogen-III oxidase family protein n=1 Tax=Parafannyhessea sp. TaxID=2847324 RepID=UPI003F042954